MKGGGFNNRRFGRYAHKDDEIPADLLQWERGRGQVVPMERGGGPGGERSIGDINLEQIARSTDILASVKTLNRGLIGRSVTVGTTATLIVRADAARAYTILNPSLIVGTTAYGTLVASAARIAAGNSQASSLGVANYGKLHLFLNVTAVSGTTPILNIYAQAIDPVTSNWADVQAVWTGIDATGPFPLTLYSPLGDMGLTTDFAVRWEITGTTPSFTFSIGYVLKDGLLGDSAGLSKIIYLGGNAGVTTNAGYPLLEGQSDTFFIKENIELWGIASSSLDLRVFEL